MQENPPRYPLVAVIGASSAEPTILDVALQVGCAIGNKDWNLLTGGGGGVMEAACKGFRNAPGRNHGVAIGILPSDDDKFANSYVDVALPTGMGWARNAIITRSAWGLVAVGGETGTLSEIAFAWQMNKPIAAMVGTGGWSEKLAGLTLDSRRVDAIFKATSADEAIGFLEKEMLIP